METNVTDQTVTRTSASGHRRWRSVALLAVLVALGFGVAACGGAAPSGVANIGHSRKGQTVSGYDAGAVEYSVCIREHGVPNFPDPTFSDGGLQANLSWSGPKGASATAVFLKAEKACYKYSPSYVPPGMVSQTYVKEMVAWTACMRAHGVPNLPDPTTHFPNTLHVIGGYGVWVILPNGVDPASAVFTGAQKACPSPSPSAP